ncbi:MAG: hypothetical protein ABIO40_01340 [Devosia sp.]
MFRIAALVAGALAGFLASLILALGGLEVTESAFGGVGPQQLALARYGLIFLANLSVLGAGVALAVPRAGAVLFGLAAVSWAVAAAVLGHRADAVLFGPPALNLIAVALAVLAEIFGRRSVRALATPVAFEPDPYDVTPNRGRAAATRDPLAGIPDRDFIPGRLSGPGERSSANRRLSEKPAFRRLEDEDEPSGLRRAGRALTGLLSFGLYAGAAAAALLVVYTIYRGNDGAALVAAPAVAEQPASSSSEQMSIAEADSELAPTPVAPSSAEPEPSSAEIEPASDTEIMLTPVPLGPTQPVISQQPNSEQPRLVGEAPPADAVPVGASEPADLETAPSEEPATTAPDSIDTGKVAPTPATMSAALAAARKKRAFIPGKSDI